MIVPVLVDFLVPHPALGEGDAREAFGDDDLAAAELTCLDPLGCLMLNAIWHAVKAGREIPDADRMVKPAGDEHRLAVEPGDRQRLHATVVPDQRAPQRLLRGRKIPYAQIPRSAPK